MIRIKRVFDVLIGLSILLAVWESIILTGKYEVSLLPSPWNVFEGMGELVKDGTLLINIKVSLIRFSIGYFSAVLVAIISGLILGQMRKMWNIIDPIVQVLRPISPIAWSPFIVLWFGIGDIPAIVIIFIAAFFPVLLSTVSAVKKVDPTYLKIAQNFGIKQPHLLTKIIFPASFPFIANGLHLALGTAWIFLVAGEMVGAQSGLGYLIVDARNSVRMDLVLAGILLIGILGLILDKAIKLLEIWVEKQWGISSSLLG